jgi:hypothetical protein
MYSTLSLVFASRSVPFQTTFHGAMDHSLLTEYRVFVNPSLSEVLCTTIVEVCTATLKCSSLLYCPTYTLYFLSPSLRPLFHRPSPWANGLSALSIPPMSFLNSSLTALRFGMKVTLVSSCDFCYALWLPP